LAKVVVRCSGDNDGSGWLIIKRGANAPLADSENASFAKPENAMPHFKTYKDQKT
jgi:hypothetical protein